MEKTKDFITSQEQIDKLVKLVTLNNEIERCKRIADLLRNVSQMREPTKTIRLLEIASLYETISERLSKLRNVLKHP